MSLAEVFAQGEAINRARVEADTWGHLAPQPGLTYRGTLLFIVGAWGDLTPVQAEFRDPRGEELWSSPWFFDHMLDWIGDQSDREVGVYRLVGSYRAFKNGKYRFAGRVEQVA